MKNKLTYREFSKLFVAFLAEHNALKQYKKNTKKYNPIQFINWDVNINPLLSAKIKNDIKNGNLNLIITHAFRWIDTKEGFTFWENLHSQWVKIMETKKIEIIPEKLQQH